jgi:heme exporter protein C
MLLSDKIAAASLSRSNMAITLLAAAAVTAVSFLAPREESMGDVQRIVYVHVGVAWCGLAGLIIAAVAGAVYLVRRQLSLDDWAQAAAELGWICSTLTLITGSIWAHEAWGTWWTWDPRLTTAFVLWAIYSGYLIVRGSVDEPHLRARIAAVLAIVGAIDVPLVVMATRWFRGMHPATPEMEPAMRLALLASVVCLTALFVVLLYRRQRQLGMERHLAELEQQLDFEPHKAATGGRAPGSASR